MNNHRRTGADVAFLCIQRCHGTSLSRGMHGASPRRRDALSNRDGDTRCLSQPEKARWPTKQGQG